MRSVLCFVNGTVSGTCGGTEQACRGYGSFRERRTRAYQKEIDCSNKRITDRQKNRKQRTWGFGPPDPQTNLKTAENISKEM